MRAFIGECASAGIALKTPPSYQDTAVALHTLVKASRRSVTIIDAPARGRGEPTEPMTVFSASDRRKTPKPARWPSKGLTAIRKLESKSKRGRKSKKKSNNKDLVDANKRTQRSEPPT